MKIIGIMAATQQGVIGDRNSLPWSYPEELEHFRATTSGHIMIMGRKTYNIIPKTSLTIVNSGEFGARSDGATPISNRRALSDDVTNFSSIDYNRDIIVFSRNHHCISNDVKIVSSLNEFLKYIQSLNLVKKLFMIGGAEIAHLFLEHNLISYFILTKIHHLYSGDTSIDLRYFKGWDEKILKEHPNYTICKLTNIKEIS
ncbi:dihydrofolate reductase [Candidatus Tisiphia endosymbiont of Sialis lutaria]|uniref:dihydrofolate reductase n=1 Tax=Candidatus Tisiphia endosymbiont of Sialis lutaria TaxID=2029164 RepID=UPI00312CA8D2